MGLISKEERIKIYKDAKDKWGENAQLGMALEEALELALAIRKFLRNPSHPTLMDVVSEIADVENMIEQMEWMYSLRELIDAERGVKLERLVGRIKENNFG